jgi:hypothetical protein
VSTDLKIQLSPYFPLRNTLDVKMVLGELLRNLFNKHLNEISCESFFCSGTDCEHTEYFEGYWLLEYACTSIFFFLGICCSIFILLFLSYEYGGSKLFKNFGAACQKTAIYTASTKDSYNKKFWEELIAYFH